MTGNNSELQTENIDNSLAGQFMQPSFIHLRVRTEFSLVDSIVRIKPLAQRLLELDMPACAVTDLNNFFGLIKFYRTLQGNGLKVIAGCDLIIRDPEEDAHFLVTLLAQNEAGCKNIIQRISKAWQSG